MRTTVELCDEPEWMLTPWSGRLQQLTMRDRDGATVHVVGTLEQMRRMSVALDGVLFDQEPDPYPEVTAALNGDVA